MGILASNPLQAIRHPCPVISIWSGEFGRGWLGPMIMVEGVGTKAL